MPNELRNRISDLFEGRVKPPTDTIAYFVNQAKTIHVEHEAVMANLDRGRQQMEALQRRRVELEAIQQKCLEGLEFWLKKEQDAQTEVNDGTAESGSDQHGDEGPGAPEEVASGVGSAVDDVQHEGPGGGSTVADRGAGNGGDHLGVQGSPKNNRNRPGRKTKARRQRNQPRGRGRGTPVQR